MSKIHSRTFRARFAEVDAFWRVSSPQILRYFVETAWDWGASEGLSLQESQASGLLWLVREMEYALLRPLRYNDSFTVTVWMQEWKRVRGARGFELRLAESGELAARGVNQVALLDPASLRPVEAPGELIERFRLEQPTVIPYQRFPRPPEPPASAYRMHRQVEWRDMDMFAHVNNAVYADYCDEAAAQALAALGWPPSRFIELGLALENRRLHIQFQEPALWGEALEISTFAFDLTECGGQRWTIIQRAADHGPVAAQLTGWQLNGWDDAQPCSMPGELRQALTA
jgi:YbgC/YbaW family acyl-CoA thioester hydrolase